ncbi:hypothetical protein [Zobellia uliginosa]|uniref:hypothetical protein n=1 Tax=Zobellia uliginosa TaxID=143224 RepID=UPI0026E480A1|nr:hypothetical protein [Zobellia uliginosa]MDO6516577.1 hypothetical protein [Zobellia uliginosa]
MQDEILILKNTESGIATDTIGKLKDTIRLDLKQHLVLPDNEFVVYTKQEPLSGIEYWGLWIAAIAAVIAMLSSVSSIKKLFKKDKEQQQRINLQQQQIEGQQNQINELIKLNKLFEKRVRMTVKPHLWTNGSGYNGTDHTIHIRLDNRGEIAFYEGFETLEGEGLFWLQEWEQDIPIKKDTSIQLSGSTTAHPTKTYFKIKIHYYDSEHYNYETIIEWNNGKVRFVQTDEL